MGNSEGCFSNNTINNDVFVSASLLRCFKNIYIYIYILYSYDIFNVNIFKCFFLYIHYAENVMCGALGRVELSLTRCCSYIFEFTKWSLDT